MMSGPLARTLTSEPSRHDHCDTVTVWFIGMVSCLRLMLVDNLTVLTGVLASTRLCLLVCQWVRAI